MALCRECNHFEYAINPDTGRKTASQRGDCKYPLIWPTMPKAYEVRGYSNSYEILYPRALDMWPHDDRDCKCFDPIEPRLPT